MDPEIQTEISIYVSPEEEMIEMERQKSDKEIAAWKKLSVGEQQKGAECAIDMRYFEALFLSNTNSDEKRFIRNKYHRPSKWLFPCVTSIIKTGSRAEQLYLDVSDKDDIYEVGPGTVQIEKSQSPNNCDFYCIQTKFPGFYTIHDDKDDFLYPQILQAKLASSIAYNNERPGTISGLLPSGNSNETYMETLATESTSPSIKVNGDDKVIAMRLEKWPNGLSLEGKLSWISSEKVKNIQDCPLYLVPKSHPRSKFPEIEWRLSYSIVEKKVMLALPYLYRKAYLISKEILQAVKGIFRCEKITSFHLKTILLHYLDREEKATNLYDTVQQLLTELLNAYKDKKLWNYFINEINLLDLSENYEECEKMLEWITTNLNMAIVSLYNFNVDKNSYCGIIKFYNLIRNNDHNKFTDPNLMLAVILLELYSRLIMEYFTNLNVYQTVFGANEWLHIIAVMQLLVTGYMPPEKITIQNFSRSFHFQWEPRNPPNSILNIARRRPDKDKFYMQWNKLKQECEEFSNDMKKVFDMKVCVDIIKSKEGEIQSLIDIYELDLSSFKDMKDPFYDSKGNINPFQIIEKSPLEDAVVCLDKSLKKFFPGETQNA